MSSAANFRCQSLPIRPLHKVAALRIAHGGKASWMGIRKVLIVLAMSWCLRLGAPGFGEAVEPVVAVSERWGISRAGAFLVRYGRWFEHLQATEICHSSTTLHWKYSLTRNSTNLRDSKSGTSSRPAPLPRTYDRPMTCREPTDPVDAPLAAAVGQNEHQ